jgi:transposase
LSRYLDGNTGELAVIRVPSEAEEQARHVSRQREQLVQLRQKLEAQGRSLLVNHGLPSPAHWWKNQTWSRLSKLLPGWMVIRLEVHRPALLTLQEQIDALSSQLEAAAPANVPVGIGKLTTVAMTLRFVRGNGLRIGGPLVLTPGCVRVNTAAGVSGSRAA